MSYSIFYNSFRPDIADQKWNNFDIVINDALDKKKKIEELQKKSGLDEYDIDEELIYNPQLKAEYERKRAEIIKAKHNVEEGLQTLESQNNVSQAGILYYIENQTPMESDIIITSMIELDLLFGGQRASYCSALDPIGQAETTLRILFPEINIPRSRAAGYVRRSFVKADRQTRLAVRDIFVGNFYPVPLRSSKLFAHYRIVPRC